MYITQLEILSHKANPNSLARMLPAYFLNLITQWFWPTEERSNIDTCGAETDPLSRIGNGLLDDGAEVGTAIVCLGSEVSNRIRTTAHVLNDNVMNVIAIKLGCEIERHFDHAHIKHLLHLAYLFLEPSECLKTDSHVYRIS